MNYKKAIKSFAKVFLVICLVLAVCTVAMAGSRFYITIEKSFSTSQKPVVRVDFVDENQLIELRILKPKNLDAFVQKQLNISRSYEEPLSSINPGHYFVKGLNQVSSPLTLFRSAINPAFRQQFGGSDFNNPYFEGAQKLLSLPRELKIREPKDFEVVRSSIINLKNDNQTADGLYDDEENGWWNSERYKVKDIELDELPSGIYLVQAIQGTQEAQSLLQVSSLGVQVKQSADQLLVRAVTRDLAPVANAKVSIRDSRGQWQDIGSPTDDKGEVLFQNKEGGLDGKLIVKVVSPDGAFALSDTDFLPSVSQERSSFIVTDRPIFKPGDDFSYKGMVRVDQNGDLVVPKISAKQADVALYSADGTQTDISQKVSLTDFGSYSGTFSIPETQKPGLYRVVSTIDGKPYSGELRIKDYVKPTFYLEMISHDPVLTPGEKFSMKIRGKRYSGGTPKGVKYEVYVYRKKFASPTWVEEAGGGLSTGHDYFGAVKSASALAQPQRLYSSVEERKSEDGYSTDTWSSAAALNEEGVAEISITIPKVPEKELEEDWIYTVTVRAMDTAGAQALLNTELYMTRSDAVAAVKFDKPVYPDTDSELLLRVIATSPQGENAKNAFGSVKLFFESAQGGTKELPSLSYKTDEKGNAVISIPSPKERGMVKAEVNVDGVDGKKSARPSVSLPVTSYIGGKDGDAVIKTNDLSLVTQSTILSPGQKEKVLAILPSEWGTLKDNERQGVIWQSFAGAKIHESKADLVKGLSAWFPVEAKPEYGTGFFHTVTVPLKDGKFTEQTIGFRILPKNKILSIKTLPSQETTVPNAPFKIDFDVTDSSGAPAAATELSVSVVDKAVYAVQPEFRASILDFFYPLPRLNLGTFYSDELQGYGYSDVIKKPNFLLSALKNSVKPQNKSMRDTAGWFPHVVTDAKGKASVTVMMPANITEWVITAIAADKKGRVGEVTGGFRSTTDLVVEPILPSYIRDGDTLKGFIRLENTSDKKADVTFQAKGDSNFSVSSKNESNKIAVDQKSSQDVPLEVKTVSNIGGKADLTLSALAPGLRVGGAQQFEIATQSAALKTTLPGELTEPGALTFSIPEGANATTVQVNVANGFIGASLLAAERLVSYPYGCTEQLAHSTFPNLALLNLIKTGELSEAELKERGLNSYLEKAKENAEIGVRKIRGNQKPDGGFSLWSVDSNASVPVTLIATRALYAALQADVETARQPFDSAVRWLNGELSRTGAQVDSKESMELIRILSQVNEFDYSQRAVFISFIDSTLKADHPSLERVLTALEVLFAAENTYWLSGQVKTSVNEMKKNLISKLRERIRLEESKDLSLSEPPLVFDESGFYRGEASTNARILSVLVRANALTQEDEQLYFDRITTSFQSSWWGSTYETGETIFNLMPVLKNEIALAMKPENKKLPKVLINNRPAGALSAVFGGYKGDFVLPKEIDSEIKVAVENINYEVSVLSGMMPVQIPFNDLLSVNQGIVVERELLKIAPAGGVKTLQAGESLKKGDVVVSKVSIKRDTVTTEWGSSSRLLVVEDGIPSIAEGIEEDKTLLADAGIKKSDDSYWLSVKETLRYPQQTTRIVEIRPGAQASFYQVWRVRFDGDVSLPPATAVDMYNEKIHGNSSAGRIAAK